MAPTFLRALNKFQTLNAFCSKSLSLETVSQYAIPNAIGPSNSVSNPIINLKIKEEPVDQYEESFPSVESNPITMDEIEIKCEPFCDIEVKNESIENPHEETIGSNIPEQYNTENKSVCDSTFDSVMPLRSYSPQKFQIIKIDSSNSKCLDSEPFPSVEAPKFNDSVMNTSAMPLKNIKILKFAPKFKIFKLPPVKVTPIKNGNETSVGSIKVNQPRPSDSISTFQRIKLQFSSTQMNDSKSKNTSNDTVSIKTEAPTKQEVKEETTLSRKRNIVSKTSLRCIESQPQTIKIIEEFQRKITEAENVNAIILPIPENIEKKLLNYTPENIEQEASKGKIVESIAVVPPPSSLYLPVTGGNLELFSARNRYINYRFSWICPHCAMKYDKKSPFLAHLIRVHKMCREEFEKLVVEVRPFQVDDSIAKKMSCLAKFKKEIKQDDVLKAAFIENQETNPGFLSYSKFRCPNCLRTCSSRSMLHDHIAGNCTRLPLYKCSECPKAFHSASTLSSHRSIHTGELPYKCDYCDKRFRTPGQVRVHHRSHTGERPFACQICTQKFAHRETLISHLSRHIGMKRYQCYACGKRFSCVSGLKNHHDLRQDTCGRVKLNTRAVGPRVRVIRGQVHFEPQPEINPYLRTEDPQDILTEIQNIQTESS